MNTATCIHFVKSFTNNNKIYEYAIMSLVQDLSRIKYFYHRRHLDLQSWAWDGWRTNECMPMWIPRTRSECQPGRKVPTMGFWHLILSSRLSWGQSPWVFVWPFLVAAAHVFPCICPLSTCEVMRFIYTNELGQYFCIKSWPIMMKRFDLISS